MLITFPIGTRCSQGAGWTLDEIHRMGRGFMELVHPEDHARVEEHLRRIRKAGDKDVLEIEDRFRTKDGNWIRCTSREAVFERNEQGKVIRVIGSLLDISGNQKDKD